MIGNECSDQVSGPDTVTDEALTRLTAKRMIHLASTTGSTVERRRWKGEWCKDQLLEANWSKPRPRRSDTSGSRAQRSTALFSWITLQGRVWTFEAHVSGIQWKVCALLGLLATLLAARPLRVRRHQRVKGAVQFSCEKRTDGRGRSCPLTSRPGSTGTRERTDEHNFSVITHLIPSSVKPHL
jgi:hypothetical protein